MDEPPTPPAAAPDGPPPRGSGDGVGDGVGCVDWADALSRHGGWLRRLILARVGERQAVEEVMQEVGLAAAAQPARNDGRVGPTQAAAWLYRVAVRQVLLYRRRLGRRRRLMDGAAQSQVRPESDGPLGWLVSAERDELVRQALSRLPGRDADVLVLKYAEQWSYKQLAEHLGISESAVEARLHRARRRMREELVRLRLNEDLP